MAGNENYRIVKSQLPLIGGTAGHNLIAVLDANGRVIHELNGLATSKDGEIKPIGYLPSDRLRVYNEKEVEGFYYNSSQNQQVVFEGSYQEVMSKFNLGYAIGQEINNRNIPYPILGLGENSNSVASTLLKGMGLRDPDLGNALTPGEGSLLIPEEELKRIRQNWEQKHSQNPTQSQSTFDKVSAMVQGLINDTDGSYAKKVIEEHSEEMTSFEEKVRLSIEQDRQRELAERGSQTVQHEEQQRNFSRSFG
ncbi:hypothetical protein [Neisseria arctica]|uniref:hypothetical protein n=1 Tax=Neisseria arctica TaxID=1470200 RepID=UPI00069AF73D|nr:hypothetical protein [Neisseria arctica]UOO86090.1 hypothetical protein LVJ86_07625 [Neisseria arctica]